MAKVALLIAVSMYEAGFPPFPAAKADVEAMSRVLRDPEVGGFDQVTVLVDRSRLAIEETIYDLFSDRYRDDLVLFYFSGHGVTDEMGKLYLTTRNTRTNTQGLFVRSTAVSASFLHEAMSNSRSRRQVIILDCAFSGAFTRDMSAIAVKGDSSIDVGGQLGGSGRAILTSSTSTQFSFEQKDSDLSIYTRYLVEGIATGAADWNSDGLISVDELHEYASLKVREAAPNMSPKIYLVKEGYNIVLAKAPVGDPKLIYRKEVELYTSRDGLSPVRRKILDTRREQLSLSLEDATAIEAEILRPYGEYQRKLQMYTEAFVEAVRVKYPLSEETLSDLKYFQQALSLRDEDIETIEAQVISKNLSPMDLRRSIRVIEQISSRPPSLLEKFVQATCGLIAQLSRSKRIKSKNIETSYDDLRSERGLDYILLRDFLKAGRWKDADYETYKIMLRVVGRKEGEWIREDEIKQFSCVDLRTIDQLWVNYSEGHFGFSIQRKIYLECGGQIDGNYDEGAYERFGDRVGWRLKGSWIPYYDLIFDLTAPSGHLPRPGGWVKGASSLFSRLEACRL